MPAPRGFSDFRIVREPAGEDTTARRSGAESADAVLSAGVRPSVSATDGAAAIKAPTPRASATAPTLTGPNPPPRPEIPTLGKGYSTNGLFQPRFFGGGRLASLTSGTTGAVSFGNRYAAATLFSAIFVVGISRVP